MATLVIGDVHGQLQDLRALIASAGVRRGADKVILVGDLVGRGEASLETLRFVAEHGDLIEVVLGNHDLGLLWSHYTGSPASAALDEVLAAADAARLCDWLRTCPLAVHLEHAGTLVVHAGVWRTWDARQTVALAREVQVQLAGDDHVAALKGLYGSQQTAWDADLAGPDRWQLVVNVLTRMRACEPDGRLALGFSGGYGEAVPAGLAPWFDLAGRRLRDTLVVCGHWSTLGLTMRADLAMLDTGCCFGGPLAGLWVEDRRLVVHSS